MAEPTGQVNYHEQAVGDMLLRPIRVRVRAVFSSSGAVVTVDSTRRRSHQATITGASGTYAVAGLPRGQDYHVTGVHLNPGTGTKLINLANVSAFDAGAGTLTFLTRQSSDGVVTAPADDTVVYLTLDAETGAYS